MHLIVLLVLYLAKGVFGGDGTCKSAVSLDQLNGLYIPEFAAPWGTDTIETFCSYLEDFYCCVGENDQNWSVASSNVIFEYLQKGRPILKKLCTVNEPLHKDYKQHKECYLKTRNEYYECYHRAASLRDGYFTVPQTWPKNDKSVNKCIKEIELFFCMGDRIQETCDDPGATRFYLDFTRWTNLPSIYCSGSRILPYVQRAIGDEQGYLDGKEKTKKIGPVKRLH